MLPPQQLVIANGWIEGLTVASIIIGTMLGGALVTPAVSAALLSIDIPRIDTGIDTGPEAAILVISLFYLIAAVFNLRIPDTGAKYHAQTHNPVIMVKDFVDCFATLWRDKLGQISLAVTTLFWGAGATLQFIVLRWAEQRLHMPLSQGAILQGIVAIGVALGAVIAGRTVPLKKSLSVLPVGAAMGLAVMSLTVVTWMPLVYFLLILVGALAGFFVVPMNALLQHRGHVLLSAGHSIAVQNFNENLNILLMLGLYALMIRANFAINTIIVLFGVFVCLTMMLVIKLHKHNQTKQDSLHLIGMEKH
jgi:hypothetical protein